MRIKKVVNPKPRNIITNKNTLTPTFFVCGILVCIIACTGTCVVVVGMVNVCCGAGIPVCSGIGCTIACGATTNHPSFPHFSRRFSVGVGVIVGFPSIASRSNVFAVSMACVCGSIVASVAKPPPLVCHSNSSIIFISFCKEDASGIFQSTLCDEIEMSSIFVAGSSICTSVFCICGISFTIVVCFSTIISGIITSGVFSGVNILASGN